MNYFMAAAKGVPNSRQFIQAYLAMERPNTTHLLFTKGILDFLVGMIIGIVIGIILVNYI